MILKPCSEPYWIRSAIEGGLLARTMGTPVVMPQLGESVTEGTVARWLKKVGDYVERDEIICEISTDKVDAEIPSPAPGVLTEIRVTVGQTVAVTTVLATIGDALLARASDSASETTPTLSDEDNVFSNRAESKPGNVTGPRSSPVVRRIAREHQIDVTLVAGSGPRGRVTKADILAYVETRATTVGKAGAAEHAEINEASTALEARSNGPHTTAPLTLMRKRIAEHMVLSRRTAAHVHTVFHVDFSAASVIRDARRGEFERGGVKLTLLSFIAKAVVDALPSHPLLNSSLKGNQIVYKHEVNLGIAVALDEGLIVPVIKNAGDKSLLGISRAIADLSVRARARQLRPEEVQGGTFTITNPGMLGGQFAMPIINQPQSAILGVGVIEKRAIVVGNAIGIRPMAYLTLGFDHRLVDGVVADSFMAEVKQRIEDDSVALDGGTNK